MSLVTSRQYVFFVVRLCSDRIGLIKECICQSPMCYKQSTKLLGLAELLRVAGKF